MDLSPFDNYFQGLDEVQGRYSSHIALLVVGIEMDDDDEGKHDDPLNNDPSSLTQEQVTKLRHIVITPNRELCFAVHEEYVSCGLVHSNSPRFTSSHANRVMTTLNERIDLCLRHLNANFQYDNLLGLTCNLMEYKHWLYDNEYCGPAGKISAHVP
jgi:hypothetical protein